MAEPTAPPAAPLPPASPRAEAQRLLEEGQRLLGEALEAIERGGLRQASDLVGQASDRTGSALHFLRLAQRA